MREKLINLRKLNERNDTLYRKKFITKDEYISNLHIILSRIRDLKVDEEQNLSILQAITPDLNINNFRICVGTLNHSIN